MCRTESGSAGRSDAVAALPGMLEQDRKQAGWSVGQAARRLRVSVRECREIEAGASRKASSRGNGTGIGSS